MKHLPSTGVVTVAVAATVAEVVTPGAASTAVVSIPAVGAFIPAQSVASIPASTLASTPVSTLASTVASTPVSTLASTMFNRFPRGFPVLRLRLLPLLRQLPLLLRLQLLPGRRVQLRFQLYPATTPRTTGRTRPPATTRGRQRSLTPAPPPVTSGRWHREVSLQANGRIVLLVGVPRRITPHSSP